MLDTSCYFELQLHKNYLFAFFAAVIALCPKSKEFFLPAKISLVLAI